MSFSVESLGAIIDRVYEASVLPELWPSIMADIAKSVDAAGGLLLVTRDSEIRWTGSQDVLVLMEAFLAGGWDKRNSRAERLAAMHYPGFIHDLDAFTLQEIEEDPFYNELCRPLGFGWSAGTQVHLPNGDLIIVSIDRRFEGGPFDQSHVGLLDLFRPHLARAGMLSAQLRLTKATGMTEALDLMGIPAAVLRSDGRVIARNLSFDTVSSQVSVAAFDKLYINDQRGAAMFADVLANLGQTGFHGPMSIPIHAGQARAAILHLLPIRRAAHDVFNDASAVVVVTPVGNAALPPEALLNGLFDLTPAEARAARCFASGMSARAVSEATGLSYETTRAYLKVILAKTGTHRQSELVSMLHGVSLPRTSGDKRTLGSDVQDG